MTKKIAALFLSALIALGLFAGCAGVETAVSPSASPAPSASAAVSDEPTAKPEEKNLAVADGGSFTLPLTDDAKTFTIWTTFAADHMQSPGDSHAYQELERRTGVHIDWYCVTSAASTESFQLAMVSEDYDDSYFASITYLTYGQDYYIDNDILIDLEPKIAEYAPNYDYVRGLTDGTKTATLSDSGRCVSFYKIMQNLQWAYFGPLGRYDWLEGLGKAVPTTYDELHDVLVGFRDVYGAEMPLSILPSGIDDWLLAGFDTMYSTSVTGNVYIQKNGVAVFGAAEPGFREYVQLMADWYAEGLIDPDFYSKTGYPGLNGEYVLNNKMGVGISLYTYPDYFEKLAANAGDTGFEWRGFKCPVKNAGDTRKVVMGGGQLYYRGNLGAFISTACDDAELLMRWFDYFYTKEGAELCSYGVLGESYEYDAEGKPQYLPVVYENPDGLSLGNAIMLYSCFNNQASWYCWERELVPTTSQNVWDTKELFEGNWEDEYTMPQITMTADENKEYGAIIADINTYIAENVVKFITGQRAMSEYDDMISLLDGMDISRATEIQQAALDRYNAR